MVRREKKTFFTEVEQGREKILKEIMAKTLPNLIKTIYTSKKLNKFQVGKHKETSYIYKTYHSKYLESSKRKTTSHSQGNPKKITPDFSSEIMKAKRQCDDIFEVLKPKKYVNQESYIQGTSLAVQWLRLCASTVGGMGSIPGWGTKIQHAMRCSPKKKKRILYSVKP